MNIIYLYFSQYAVKKSKIVCTFFQVTCKYLVGNFQHYSSFCTVQKHSKMCVL